MKSAEDSSRVAGADTFAQLRGRAGLLAVLVALSAALALWPTAESLDHEWRSINDYGHGYLVALISAVWFGIVARTQWVAPARPNLLAACVLGAGLFLWLIAYNANIVIGYQVLFPACAWMAVCAVAGWRVGLGFAAPIAFLYFAVPVWDYIVPVLQRMSVSVSETLLGWMGIPAHVSEFTVTIPEGAFQIVEGCSGKRYFMVATAAGTLMAVMERLRGWRFAVPIVGAAVLALVANWIRIIVIIYAGHVTQMQHYLVAKEHITFGAVVFGFLLAGVVLSGRLVQSRSSHAAAATAPTVPMSAASIAEEPPTRMLPLVVVPFGLLAVLFALMEARANATAGPANLVSLPLATGTWQGPLPPAQQWQPSYVGADAKRRAAYASADGTVEVYINAYGEQRQGRELVNFGNKLLAPGEWHRAWPETLETLSSQPPLVSFEARSGDGSLWLVAYTFEVGGWVTVSEPLAQLGYGVRSFLGPAPSGMVALASRCIDTCEAARSRVSRFWGDSSASLLAILPDARSAP